jgi:transcriptional regulator with XRE-family HTH domain
VTETTADVLVSIGRRVGEERAARELTQAAFAKRLGVGTRYLQRVEAGEENLTVDTLVVLATTLDLSVADLFRPPTQPKPRRGRPTKKTGTKPAVRQR